MQILEEIMKQHNNAVIYNVHRMADDALARQPFQIAKECCQAQLKTGPRCFGKIPSDALRVSRRYENLPILLLK